MLDPPVGTVSSTAQLAFEELDTLGLAGFARQHKRHKADSHFVRFRQMAVPSTAMAAAIVRLGIGISSPNPDLSAPHDVALRLRQHGVEQYAVTNFRPPVVGDQFLNRKDIWRVYGGDSNSGIIKFPDSDIVNCFSDDNSGSYADDRPSQFEPFGYRGAGLHGDQEFKRGNRFLEEAFQGGSAIRFWHKPIDGAFTFLYWCIVVGRHWERGLDADQLIRREIVWVLQNVSDPINMDIPAGVREMGAAETADMDAGPGPEVEENPSYLDLRRRATERRPGQSRRDYIASRPIRNRSARRAVLIRAEDKCEAPWCESKPIDTLATGEAILEVDHVNDLAGGGDDSPSNMVALCPNCHASKTRGANAKEWRTKLARIASDRDAAMLSRVK